jgi:hypothetical protein
MSYSAKVDGVTRTFRVIESTAVYHGDESCFVWLETAPVELAKGLHEIVVSGGWQHAKCDVLILTANAEYTPSAEPGCGGETPIDLSLLVDDDQRKKYLGYTVWTRPLEHNVAPDDAPEDVLGVESLSVSAAVNEYEAANFIVTNWQDVSVGLRVTVGDLSTEDQKQRIESRYVDLLHALPLQVWDGRKLADPLPRLDPSGVLMVPPGESRQVWLRFHTRDLQPGEYVGKVILEQLNSDDLRLRRELKLTLTVWPFALPEEHPLLVFLNEYDLQHPGAREDLAAHYVTAFHVCRVPGPIDGQINFSGHDAEVRAELKHARGIVFEHWHFRQSNEWKTEPGRKKWQRWIKAWADHVQQDLGLAADRFWLHIYDEQGGAAVNDFIAARKLIEQVSPEVQDVTTVAPWTTFDEIKRMDPHVAVWSPLLSRLENEEELKFYQQTGKPVVPYVCNENKRAFDPYAFYRLFPWKIWHYQLHGCWIWTYLGGNAWNGRRWDGGVVYPGHGEIITSRRWELFRDGLEDYLYLHLLRKRLDAQAKIGTNVDATRKLIDDAVTAVLGTSNDPALAQTWRKRMAEMIME